MLKRAQQRKEKRMEVAALRCLASKAAVLLEDKTWHP